MQVKEVYWELLVTCKGKAHLAEGQQAQACSDPLPVPVPGLPEPQSLSLQVLQALPRAPDLAVALGTQTVPVPNLSRPQTCKACPSRNAEALVQDCIALGMC